MENKILGCIKVMLKKLTQKINLYIVEILYFYKKNIIINLDLTLSIKDKQRL